MTADPTSWSVGDDDTGLQFRAPDGQEHLGFIWPTGDLWKLLSAMTWRTYPVDHGQALSHVPTGLYAGAIQAAVAALRPIAATEPRSPEELADEARCSAKAERYEHDDIPVASAGRVLHGEASQAYGRALIAGTLQPNDPDVRVLD